MSAFVVRNEIINRIVASIDLANYGNGMLPVPETPILSETRPEDLGVLLREMNEDAVGQRYPDLTVDEFPGTVDDNQKLIPYQYYEVPPADKEQLFKDLSNLIYQCFEGDVPQQPLFVEIRTYRERLGLR
jgi:hypothetical protein